jgi:3-hydroxyisobutyrate dehydrogenase-like beta-hydroxyacid dehydrogenase
MKVGFIGLGGMGQAMARRLIDGGHEVGVCNRTAEKLKPLTEHGAKAMASIKDTANYGAVVLTMLADDAAVLEVVGQAGGLKDSLPKGGIHICSGTHSVAAMRKLAAVHGDAGQVLLAAPMLGRPDGGQRRALPAPVRRDRCARRRARPRSGVRRSDQDRQ